MKFEDSKIKEALYRSFEKKWLYFDPIVNHRVYQWPKISGRVIWVKVGSAWPFFVLMSDLICDHLPQGGSQCFPLCHLKNSAVAQFRQRYSDNSITKEDLFHYLYALLHHPEYRERYAANLKRELPRIPFAPDFAAFATAGKELAGLYVEYEALEPWPLENNREQRRPILRARNKDEAESGQAVAASERIFNARPHSAGGV